MKKVAVMLAEGFEEGESLETIDILRRCGIHCESVSIGQEIVQGCNGIRVVADKQIENVNFEEYDMIVLPGGMPGAENLKNNKKIIQAVQDFNTKGKYIAAICAAPIVLKKAGISTGRTLTSYPAEKYREYFKDANYVTNQIVVVDHNLITSQGPATVFPFAYQLADILNGNVVSVKKRMLYENLVRSYK